ncbi:kelch domain-containing protein 3 isoform X2 [Manihot esculenta]|uniref:kelch domain-containing protein 3 isoform X2 n=1 Tax=Manihot esculenta TaxID=3983 RepID=UPI000B5D4B05|nr:kelch domain-containing protein 3 isoform X2 [Manihot esculenta]
MGQARGGGIHAIPLKEGGFFMFLVAMAEITARPTKFMSLTLTWSQPVIKGTPPTPRDSHSCTTVGDNLFVFGGTDGMNPLKDLHILDTSSHTWISPTVRGEGPEAREGHSAALVGKRLFIFGGCGKSSNNNVEVYYNDIFILNTETFVWKQAATSGTPPSARDSHTCSSWNNKIVVVGGEDGHDYYLSDVHILDAETLVWKELNTTGQKLPPRAGHSTVAFGKNLFVFGGFTDAQNLYDDLYMLDVDTGIWTKVMTTGVGPSARFSVAGDCLDPQISGVLVFIGGCNKNLEALDDMFYLHTGLTSIRDERRLEKLSLRKQLKLKCQEQILNSPVNDKALVRIDTSTDFHHTVPTYAQPSVENLQMSQAQLHQGKKIFQAKVTESFPHGYTIETIIDGKPLRGILFANKPITTQMVNNNNTRKRVGGQIGSSMLNGDHNNKSKASRTLRQDALDHMQPDNALGKETATHEPKTEEAVTPDSKNLPSSDVSQICKAPANPESSVAPLNLNDDMISDAPNSSAKFPDVDGGSFTSSLSQGGRTTTVEVEGDPGNSVSFVNT